MGWLLGSLNFEGIPQFHALSTNEPTLNSPVFLSKATTASMLALLLAPAKARDLIQSWLVGGWTNPFEKYARQIGSFPQVRVKIKHIWNHQPAEYFDRFWSFPVISR